jgi:hypothetical protein
MRNMATGRRRSSEVRRAPTFVSSPAPARPDLYRTSPSENHHRSKGRCAKHIVYDKVNRKHKRTGKQRWTEKHTWLYIYKHIYTFWWFSGWFTLILWSDQGGCRWPMHVSHQYSTYYYLFS